MADKKLVEAITSMEEDFAQWYTDVVKKAELIDYTSVKGCMVLRPAGYAIWELIQQQLDAMFKATGVQNVYLPMSSASSAVACAVCPSCHRNSRLRRKGLVSFSLISETVLRRLSAFSLRIRIIR